jgi:PilZ domain
VRLRPKQQARSAPVGLPEAGEGVVLSAGGGRIPARVIESAPDELLVVITVPTRPLTQDQLGRLVVEYSSSRGRVRLAGSLAAQDPAEPDLVRVVSPRSIEVLQEREFVRIRSARPVLVFSARGGGQVQSFTVDVSGGGLLLAGPDTLSIGDELSFRLTITPGVAPVTGSGRVVRIDSQGRRAVEFSSISELDRRRLVRFIFECQRDELRRGLEGGGRG